MEIENTYRTVTSGRTVQDVLLKGSSGATTTEPWGGYQSQLEVRPVAGMKRRLSWKDVAIATMLSMSRVDEWLTATHRHEAITASSYFIIVADEIEDWFGFPSVVSVRPHRHTLFFSSDQPVPLIGPRRPFIAPSLIADYEE